MAIETIWAPRCGRLSLAWMAQDWHPSTSTQEGDPDAVRS